MCTPILRLFEIHQMVRNQELKNMNKHGLDATMRGWKCKLGTHKVFDFGTILLKHLVSMQDECAHEFNMGMLVAPFQNCLFSVATIDDELGSWNHIIAFSQSSNCVELSAARYSDTLCVFPATTIQIYPQCDDPLTARVVCKVLPYVTGEMRATCDEDEFVGNELRCSAMSFALIHIINNRDVSVEHVASTKNRNLLRIGTKKPKVPSYNIVRVPPHIFYQKKHPKSHGSPKRTHPRPAFIRRYRDADGNVTMEVPIRSTIVNANKGDPIPPGHYKVRSCCNTDE